MIAEHRSTSNLHWFEYFDRMGDYFLALYLSGAQLRKPISWDTVFLSFFLHSEFWVYSSFEITIGAEWRPLSMVPYFRTLRNSIMLTFGTSDRQTVDQTHIYLIDPIRSQQDLYKEHFDKWMSYLLRQIFLIYITNQKAQPNP